MKYLKSKPGSLEAAAGQVSGFATEQEYQKMFKKELDKAGKGIASMSDQEKKNFFNKIDKMYKAKNEITAAQKKLPPALQKAIMKKMKDKKEAKGHKGDIKGALKTENLVGGQKKLDKDKDGDLDAKDFAMLRKSKGTDGKLKEYGNMMAMKKMKKEDALGQEPMKKMKAPMPKEPDTSTMKDAPKAKEGMKAVVKTKQVTENRRYLQTKPGSLEEAVLKTRGLVK